MSYVGDYLSYRVPYWTSMYDPSRYNSMYDTTPTKEKPPVTSSTLNDMTVAELEALAERTANTLKEKKAAEDAKDFVTFEPYTYDRRTGKLSHYGSPSAYQGVIDYARSSLLHGLTARNCADLAAIFTAITPTR